MLAPLSAYLGQSRAQSRTQSREIAPSRSTSRPLLRGAAAHRLTHSRSSPVYTMEMAARWEASITGMGRSPTSPVSPTSRRLGGSPLGRHRDDASPTQQRIQFSSTMTASPSDSQPSQPSPNSPSRGTFRQPRANGSNHFDATGLLPYHASSPQSNHSSLPEIARPHPRKDSSGNHVVADIWPMWGGAPRAISCAPPPAARGQAPHATVAPHVAPSELPRAIHERYSAANRLYRERSLLFASDSSLEGFAPPRRGHLYPRVYRNKPYSALRLIYKGAAEPGLNAGCLGLDREKGCMCADMCAILFWTCFLFC